MQQLRNFSKAFLIFVVIAFVGSIIFAWGMDLGKGSSAKGYIAKINGEEIDPKVYDNFLQNNLNQMNQGGIVHLDWAKHVEARSNAWEQMVYNMVVSQHLKSLGLKVSDEELFQYLWNYPPQYFVNDQNLQTDGRFDMNKYHELLGNKDFAANLAYVEQQEEPQILRMQWNDLIRASVQITPEELMWEFRKSSEQIKLDYIYIPINKVSENTEEPDTAAVQAYYDEHKDKYEREPQANLSFISFDVVPSSTDTNNVSDMTVWIQQLTDATQDYFTGFASIVSDDVRAANTGGDLGWIKRGVYSPEFDSVAFSLDSGQIAQAPILTRGVWHVLKSDGKRVNENGEEEAHLYQIMKKIRPSGDTFSEKYTQAKQFYDEAKEFGFEQTAEKYGLTISESGPFVEGQSAGRIGSSEDLNDFAFTAKLDEISDVVMVANLGQNTYKFVVAKLTEKFPKRNLPFEEAYAYARNDLRKEINMKKAYDLASEVLASLGERPNLQKTAAAFDLQFDTTGFITRSANNLTRPANEPEFLGAAFGMTMDKPLSEPIYAANGVVIIMLTGRVFNPAEFDNKKDAIYAALWATKVRAASENITQELIDQAKVEDYRTVNQKWVF